MDIEYFITNDGSKFKSKCFRCSHEFEFNDKQLDPSKIYDYVPCPKCGLVHQLVYSYGNKWYLMKSPYYQEALYYDGYKYM